MYRSMKLCRESAPVLRWSSLSWLKEIKGSVSTESRAGDSSALRWAPLENREREEEGERHRGRSINVEQKWKRQDDIDCVSSTVQSHTDFLIVVRDTNRDGYFTRFWLQGKLNIQAQGDLTGNTASHENVCSTSLGLLFKLEVKQGGKT